MTVKIVCSARLYRQPANTEALCSAKVVRAVSFAWHSLFLGFSVVFHALWCSSADVRSFVVVHTRLIQVLGAKHYHVSSCNPYHCVPAARLQHAFGTAALSSGLAWRARASGPRKYGSGLRTRERKISVQAHACVQPWGAPTGKNPKTRKYVWTLSVLRRIGDPTNKWAKTGGFINDVSSRITSDIPAKWKCAILDLPWKQRFQKYTAKLTTVDET